LLLKITHSENRMWQPLNVLYLNFVETAKRQYTCHINKTFSIQD
jgi:hypothetical protein